MALCNIQFDNPQKIYYAGQTVSGIITLPLEKTKLLQYLSVKVEGYASCKFWADRFNNSNKKTVLYSGKEQYCSSKTFLIGSIEGQLIDVPAGLHSYEFSYALPENLPTSFESNSGKIRYCCTITLERPWSLTSIKKESFTVIKQLDLNKETPVIRLINKQEVTKKYSSLFSKSGEIYMSMKLPATGFVAGQKVNAIIDVNNSSDISVHGFKLSLKKTVCYNATSPRKMTKEKVVPIEVIRIKGIEKQQKETFNVTIEIPATPPTLMNEICNIISISYEILVKAKVANTLHRSAQINIPIVIGTIPINHAVGWQEDVTNVVTTTGTFTASSSFFNGPNDEMPPPTYEEVAKMDILERQLDNEENDGEFSPKYPVYHFQENEKLKNDQSGFQ